jgi:tetratricopeptide (TPR) repeat protein
MGARLSTDPVAGGRLEKLLSEAQRHLFAGEIPRAMACAEQALTIADNPNTRLAMATVCLLAKDFKRAEMNYHEVLRQRPNHFKALLGLGQLKLNTNDPETAISVLRAAVSADPKNPDARHLLARSYGLLRRFDEALELFRALVVDVPKNADVWAGYARALTRQGSPKEAIEAYKTALELNPKDDAAHEGLAATYLSIGQIDLAEVHFKKAMEIRPDRGQPFRNLAKLKRLDAADLAEAEKQLRLLPPGDVKRITFLATVASMGEASGEYEKAFHAISEALAIRRSHGRTTYNLEAVTGLADAVINAMGVRGVEVKSAKSPTPIFIVGMPRSGSTLTEQILARHPSVYPAGEWAAMPMVLSQMHTLGRTYPSDVGKLSHDEINLLRRVYYAKLPAAETGKDRLSDKMLGNVFNVALIEAIFPDATIVWCRRHPMDSLWSTLTQVFASALEFSTRIEDVCHHALQQHRIMTAWRERGTLPTLEIFYEELVERFEPVARELVKFTGLEWNDACLKPQESDRPVLTASAGQVHQAVSKSAVGRWKPFAPYLDHARSAMGDLIGLHEAELAKRGIGG